MTALAKDTPTRAIVVEDTLPHTAETIWRVLTEKELLDRWMMKNDFAPGVGRKFTMKAHPMGDWDGTVSCEITAFDPPTLLSYTWVGGSSTNVGHGTALDSTVTWTLTPVSGGTKVRMVHDGFRSPENDMGFEAMSGGWGTIIKRIGEVAASL